MGRVETARLSTDFLKLEEDEGSHNRGSEHALDTQTALKQYHMEYQQLTRPQLLEARMWFDLDVDVDSLYCGLRSCKAMTKRPRGWLEKAKDRRSSGQQTFESLDRSFQHVG